MIRRISALVALSLTIGCSASRTEPVSQASSPAAFTGMWRSVTPSAEFVRLSVHSKSSEIGMLATRLTFSGLAWDGSGRIEGDSLVASMTRIGQTTPSGVMVAHLREGRTLRVQLRPADGAVTDLAFVRED